MAYGYGKKNKTLMKPSGGTGRKKKPAGVPKKAVRKRTRRSM